MWLLTLILRLIGVVVLFVVLLLGYIILEIVIWRWLWLRRLTSEPDYQIRNPQSAIQTDSGWSSALFYLSGLSHFSSPDLLTQQVMMLHAAAGACAPDRMLILAFPYETETAKEFLRYDLWRRLGYKTTPLVIFSLRNFLQAVLANLLPRWYGRAVAECIAQRLGFTVDQQRLVVIGNSAGGAILLSAVPFLRQRWPNLRITAIMAGGVFGSSKGFSYVEQFHQLLGTRDSWVDFGISITPSRRREGGPLLRAKEEGRYHEHMIGDMAHFGTEGYYGDKYISTTSGFIASLLQSV